MEKTYNKLVRDHIPDIINAEGRQYGTEIMSDNEYRRALLTKLVEETREIAVADRDELAKEIADLYEVIDALLLVFGLVQELILAMQQKRIKLLWTE